jgi:hypothetical protein
MEVGRMVPDNLGNRIALSARLEVETRFRLAISQVSKGGRHVVMGGAAWQLIKDDPTPPALRRLVQIAHTFNGTDAFGDA